MDVVSTSVGSINNSVHLHSVSDVVSEFGRLEDFQSLFTGVSFFVELGNQVVVDVGVFFVLSVFSIQLSVVSGQIGGSVDDELFSNGDLFFSVIQLGVQIGQLFVSFVDGVGSFDHVGLESNLSGFFGIAVFNEGSSHVVVDFFKFVDDSLDGRGVSEFGGGQSD